MRTIIAGSRTVIEYEKVCAVIKAANFNITEVVSGCARGVDTLGEQWAAASGIPVKRFPAEWNKHGKLAGPVRNQQMADYADALIAVWDGRSKGTKDMIDRASKLNKTVFVRMLGRTEPEPSIFNLDAPPTFYELREEL
jgi:hypothetical protein